jgi:hypothetical protein
MRLRALFFAAEVCAYNDLMKNAAYVCMPTSLAGASMLALITKTITKTG